MDAAAAVVVALQMVVPGLFAWSLYKSERRCSAYEKMLERNHRLFLESIARLHEIPLIEGETTDELWRRMIRLKQWREGALTPEERRRIDES